MFIHSSIGRISISPPLHLRIRVYMANTYGTEGDRFVVSGHISFAGCLEQPLNYWGFPDFRFSFFGFGVRGRRPFWGNCSVRVVG